jgi:hypothetical protein
MDRDAPSPEPMVYSLIYTRQSPQLRSPPTKLGKHTVTIHGSPHQWKAYIQWGAAWFPRGIVYDTAITTPEPCSLHHDTFHLGLGRPEPRLPACCSNPQQGIPSTPVTTSHMTQGKVVCKST